MTWKAYLRTCRPSQQLLRKTKLLGEATHQMSTIRGRNSTSVRRTVGVDNSGVWALIRDLWRLAIAETTDASDINESQAALCLGVARFTRNLVAGVPSNQFNALYVRRSRWCFKYVSLRSK